jgi:hypothetical protein
VDMSGTGGGGGGGDVCGEITTGSDTGTAGAAGAIGSGGAVGGAVGVLAAAFFTSLFADFSIPDAFSTGYIETSRRRRRSTCRSFLPCSMRSSFPASSMVRTRMSDLLQGLLERILGLEGMHR